MVVSSKKKTTGKALVRQQVNTRDTNTGEDEEAAVVSEACSAYIFKFTDTLWRYCKFGSTPLQKSKYANSYRHKFFDFPVHMKFMLISY